MTPIGIIHPGEMSVSVATCLRTVGKQVILAGEERSDGTRARATRDGIEDVGSLKRLFNEAQIVLSICPSAERSRAPGRDRPRKQDPSGASRPRETRAPAKA